MNKVHPLIMDNIKNKFGQHKLLVYIMFKVSFP